MRFAALHMSVNSHQAGSDAAKLCFISCHKGTVRWRRSEVEAFHGHSISQLSI